jgi:3-oxoacyl-[acyl-carrier-protein] synthase-3
LLDWEDRASCVLFGDGAGEVVLEASENPGIISTHLQADGNFEPLLYVEGSIADGYDNAAAGAAKVRMEGREVFKLAVQRLTATARETLAKHSLDCTDLDRLVPHQANRRIIQTVAKKLDLPLEKVVLTLGRQGNTCAASIPLALDAAVRDGRIKRGDLLLLRAFGTGFTWGSALIQY